ncbi:M48 family metallopeptidase [Roseovarius pacificus]|uniref:M48 family metallopeptidase n=1 Tax=Roseovarius pacificus TaxID=337701 RepID=UPI002A188655|nr:M48 family metallopeptidase [Roseovarius pacificus]
MRLIAILCLIGLAGCVPATETGAPSRPAPTSPTTTPSMPTRAKVDQFVSVVNSVEPVAENVCRSRTAAGTNCDFRIVVDDRPNQPVNAYQTLDKSGRPIIAFTLPMIAEVRNRDELAFVMGHEAAHHIAGHIPRQQQNAMAGAVLLGGLATLGGASADAVRTAADLGASVGARSYSKEFELEADALGTVITRAAGYDPVHGAAFFTRIPDPGDRFLGTHPPNAQRIETVRRVDAQLR